MNIIRRDFIVGGVFAAIAMTSAPALALSEGDAKAHVEKTLEDIRGLLRQSGNGESRAPQLQMIMEKRANLPLLARFSAGRAWRRR